jgi:molybdopterin adenylyltransferase
MEALRFGILTVSDRSARRQRPDASGPALKQALTGHGWQVTLEDILPDEQALLQERLASWADAGQVDVILTCGGTGFGQRDVTPEATLAVIERAAPGLAEAMRAASLLVTPHAMISRAVAGIRRQTLIVNLPGSPRGALENLQVILPVLEHAVQLLRADPAAEMGHQPRV